MFAEPGFACAHNRTYWNNDPYVGLGMGADTYRGGVRRTGATERISRRIARRWRRETRLRPNPNRCLTRGRARRGDGVWRYCVVRKGLIPSTPIDGTA